MALRELYRFLQAPRPWFTSKAKTKTQKAKRREERHEAHRERRKINQKRPRK